MDGQLQLLGILIEKEGEIARRIEFVQRLATEASKLHQSKPQRPYQGRKQSK
ncbi:MAG: hypothetical protein ACW991_04550 [Candidatus Hodarchaeales archaeon]